jgi:capsular exopolysaccharide synthesis family protein
MMSQDNRLMPLPSVERTLDKPLSDLSRSYGPAATEPSQIRDYLFVILKRKWLILSLCLVVTSLVAIQMFRQPSIYEGEATIRIEQRNKSVLSTDKFVLNAQPDANFWGTQIKLLESPSLARQVVLTLDLPNNPKFTGGGAQSGVFNALRALVSGSPKKSTAPTPPAPTGLEVVSEAQLRDKPLSAEELAQLEPFEDMIIGGETISGIPGTNLFSIKYRHSDPELAQKITNTLAEVFATNNLQRSELGSSANAIALSKQISELQGRIKADQQAQFEYAKAHNLPLSIGNGVNLEDLRANQLSTQLLQAQNDRKTAEAVYNSAKAAPDVFTIPQIEKSARVARLRDRLSELKEKRDALLVTYTKEWPEVKRADASIRLLEEELGRAAAETISTLKANYEAEKAHEESLYDMYSKQKGITSQQTRDQIEMASMAQEIETNKQLVATYQQRYQEVTMTSGDIGNEITIENFSRVPKAPIGPPRVRNIMIAFILSLVAGIGLAFLLHFLDDTIKSVDDIDRYIHLPALALIPASKGDRARLKGMAMPGASDSTALAMVNDVRSPIAESYRHLRTSLLLSSAGQPPKTILVTSSQPSEGKTTTAINTAFMLAQTGAEVLIIDCDLRRPRLHAQFEVSNAKGLTTLLSGERDLESSLQPYQKGANLKILTSGPVPPNPAELLGSEEMRKLLAKLSERFAHIIIDSPPAISFTDASILSTMVDGVVLVVHASRSSRAVVRRAKQQLLDVGAHIFGIVLNNVRLESQDYYYSGYYSNYYSTDGEDGREASPGGAA